jgi:hypothetical protein
MPEKFEMWFLRNMYKISWTDVKEMKYYIESRRRETFYTNKKKIG